MPSDTAYSSMLAAGVAIDPSRYNQLDTLEDKADLQALFENAAKRKKMLMAMQLFYRLL